MKYLFLVPFLGFLNAAEIPNALDDEALALALAFQDYEITSTRSQGIVITDSQDILKFNAVSDGLRKVFTSRGNVHAGDSYIPGQIPTIIAIAAKVINQSDGEIQVLSTKDLLHIKEDLATLILCYGDSLEGYKYEHTPKSITDIQKIIETQFSRSAKEVGSYASAQGTRVWGYTIALAINLLNDPHFDEYAKRTIVHHLVDQSIEGMLTHGGCIQGFINRGFIALMNMLSYHLPQ